MSLKILLLLSFVIGAFFGYYLWSFQWSVEQGMVLAGMVKYPANNAFSMSAHKAWTIINQLSFLFLKSGFTAITTSKILSLVAGGWAFLSCSLFVYSFTKNKIISLFFPFYVFYVYGLYVQGITYPLMWIGSDQTYGMMGISTIIFFVGLNALDDSGAKFFWAPVITSIHPSQGVWAVVIGFIENLITEKTHFFKRLWKHRFKFALGIGFTILTLLIHFGFFHENFHIENVKEVSQSTFIALRTHWSEHFHTYYPLSMEFLRVVSFGVFCLSVLVFFRNEITVSQKRIFLSLIISMFLALFFSYVYWLPDRLLVKNIFVMMMYPARLYTLAIWASSVVIPCFFLSRTSVAGKFFGLFLLLAYFSKGGGEAPDQKSVLVLQCLSIGSLLTYYVSRKKLSEMTFKEGFFKFASIGVFVIMAAVSLQNLRTISMAREIYLAQNSQKDDFYKKVGEGHKMLLVAPSAGGNYLIRSNVAVIYNAGPLVLNYIPEAGGEFNKVFKEVYGVDFYNPGRNIFQIGGDINAEMVIGLWEKRMQPEWSALGNKFEFDRVLTPKSWKLDLTPVVENGEYRLYKVDKNE